MGAGLSPSLRGAIVVGGAARRMGGQPKGLLMVGAARIVDRVHDALASVVDEVVVVGEPSVAAAWCPGLRVVSDLLPGRGAAVGIHAALRQVASPMLVVAWDMPFVSPALLALLAQRGALGGAAHDAVCVDGAQPGTLEPLCAWYTPPVADAIERGWARGERSVQAALAAVRCTRIARRDLQAMGSADRLLFNVNTPADLAVAQAWAAQT